MNELTRVARGIRRRLSPSVEERAARDLERLSRRVPRRIPCRITPLGYTIECPDVYSTFQQFHDLFVKRSGAFTAATSAPRILDCGANIGLATLFFKREYPDAAITAFEADPTLAAILRRNLGANGAADVEVVEAAVWDRDGDVTFYAEGTDSGAIDAVSGPLESRRAVKVRAVTLAPWLRQRDVDLLKLDIEGAELAALKGIRELLPRVRAMVVEVHELKPGQRLLGSVLELLDSAGFVTSLRSTTPASWRQLPTAPGPFAGAIVPFLATVQAWRA